MASESKEVSVDLSPVIKVYKDGTVETLWGSPSLNDPVTGVSSKDITISPNFSARLYLPKITDPNQKLLSLLPRWCLRTRISLLFFLPSLLNLSVFESKAVAVSVEYRLAPEHPLPAGYEDYWAALQRVASHVVEDSDIEKESWLFSHGDFDKIYMGGDSAGKNIVHNMAVRAGVENLGGGVKIMGGFLSYPFFWDSKTKKENNEESMPYKLFMFVYPSAPGGINNPIINPLADDALNLSRLACSKLFVCTAEKDDLRKINILYVEALKKSCWQGELEFIEVEGEDHCFHIINPESEKAKSLINRFAIFIRD